LATATDENGQVTTYTYNDALRRLTDVQRPDGQHVTYGYDDSARTISVGSPVQAGATNKQVTYLDGLGRAIETRIRDASDTTYSIADTQYDPLGRTYRVTNPYTSTQYWNTTQYDALGRVTFVIPPDGSVSSNNTNYVYSGSSVTVTDPTGKQRQLQSDALGRVVTVYEPDVNNNNSLTQQTSYTYDVLDRLTQVSQGVQTRSYVYDGLGRLTSATTPETGNQAVQYQYNSYSLPTSRTDARGVITMRTCHAP
jgi:YD repeat-containing protein